MIERLNVASRRDRGSVGAVNQGEQGPCGAIVLTYLDFLICWIISTVLVRILIIPTVGS